MAVGISANITLTGEDKSKAAFDSAIGSSERLFKSTQRIKAGWQSTLTAVSTAVLAVTQVIKPLMSMMMEPVNLAMEADKSMSRLMKTIEATGRGMGETSESLDKYISAVEVFTLQDEKMVSGVLASNIAYGMNVKQAKLAIEAASALAKVTGSDLWGANQLLLQSMNLQMRGIAKIVPEVNKLSDAERRQGGAITIVLEKLGYLNKMTTTTPYLAIERAGIMWEDFLRTIGRTILAGTDWNKVFEKVQESLDKLYKTVNKNKEVIGEFGAKTVITAIEAMNSLAESIDAFALAISPLTWIIGKLADAFTILALGIAESAVNFSAFITAIFGSDEAYKKLDELSTRLDKSLKKATFGMIGLKQETLNLKRTASEPISINMGGTVDVGYVKKEQELANQIAKENAKEWGDILEKLWNTATTKIDTTTKHQTKDQQFDKSEELMKQAEFGQKQKGPFSKVAMTYDQEFPAKLANFLDAVDALEKSGQSKRTLDRIKGINAINKLEKEGRKLLLDAQGKDQDKIKAKLQDFASARLKIEKDHDKSLIATEKSISAMLGNEANIRALSEFEDEEELARLQIEAGSKERDRTEENNRELERLHQKHQKARMDIQRKADREYRELLEDEYTLIQMDFRDAMEKIQKIQEEEITNIDPQMMPELQRIKQVVILNKASQSRGKVAEETLDKEKKAGEDLYDTYNNIADLYNSLAEKSQYLKTRKIVKPEDIAGLNQMAKDSTSWINSMAEGLSSFIDKLGSSMGPMGTLIATIFNMLTLAPEQMKTMVDNIAQGLIDFMPRIFENIPLLFQRLLIAVPDIIRAILESMFSLPTWYKLFAGIINAFVDMVKALFQAIVTGRSLRAEMIANETNAMTQAAKNIKQTPEFGKKTGLEGEEKFKIKDISAMKAGSIGEVMDKLPPIADKASGSFVMRITNMFDDIVSTMNKWGYEIGEAGKKLLSGEYTRKWAKELGKLGTGAMDKIFGKKTATEMRTRWGLAIDHISKNMGIAADKLFGSGASKSLSDTFEEFRKGDTLKKWKEEVGKITNPIKGWSLEGSSWTKWRDKWGEEIGKLTNPIKGWSLDTPSMVDLKDKLGIELDKIDNPLGSFALPALDSVKWSADITTELAKITDPVKDWKLPSWDIDVIDWVDKVKLELGRLANPTSDWKLPSMDIDIVAWVDKILLELGRILNPTRDWKLPTWTVDIVLWVDTIILKLSEILNPMRDWKLPSMDIDIIAWADTIILKLSEILNPMRDWKLPSLDVDASAWTSKIQNELNKLTNPMNGWKLPLWDVDKWVKDIQPLLNKLKNPSSDWKLPSLSPSTWVKNLQKELDKLKNPTKDWKLPTWEELTGQKSSSSGGGGGGEGGGGGGGKGGKGTLTETTEKWKAEVSSWKFAKGGDVLPISNNKSTVALWSAMGAMRAADGIRNVPGVGISDTVPILARAGERVLTPQQARSQDMGGNITLNIEIKVESGGVGPGKAEIREMGEKIIEYIRRESKNGRNVLRPSGVY